jgi:hypothetical protein
MFPLLFGNELDRILGSLNVLGRIPQKPLLENEGPAEKAGLFLLGSGYKSRSLEGGDHTV